MSNDEARIFARERKIEDGFKPVINKYTKLFSSLTYSVFFIISVEVKFNYVLIEY